MGVGKKRTRVQKKNKWKYNYSFQNDMEFLFILSEYISNSYVRKRLKNRLEWYMVTYHSYKRKYDFISIISIILPTVIILLNDLQDYGNFQMQCKIGISLASAIVTIASGLNSLYQWHERSIEYRNYAEILKTEAICYIAGVKEYADEEYKDQIFIQRIEELSLKENSNWKAAESSKKE